jgi:hypothetical protein
MEAPEGGTVRDVVPAEWSVPEDNDDVQRVEVTSDAKLVYFRGAAGEGESAFQYTLRAPAGVEGTNYYRFGPAELERGAGWVDVEGTEGEAFVVGSDA